VVTGGIELPLSYREPSCPLATRQGRATSVPFTTVITGFQRTTTDNARSGPSCAVLPWPR
jgi:hypothetical protein